MISIRKIFPACLTGCNQKSDLRIFLRFLQKCERSFCVQAWKNLDNSFSHTRSPTGIWNKNTLGFGPRHIFAIKITATLLLRRMRGSIFTFFPRNFCWSLRISRLVHALFSSQTGKRKRKPNWALRQPKSCYIPNWLPRQRPSKASQKRFSAAKIFFTVGFSSVQVCLSGHNANRAAGQQNAAVFSSCTGTSPFQTSRNTPMETATSNTGIKYLLGHCPGYAQ